MTQAIQVYSQFPPRSSGEKKYELQDLLLLKKIDARAYTGSLVYFDHSTLDPWIVATSIIQNTTNHIPLIAVQPYTTQPATVASMIFSIAKIYKRKVHINFITGALPKDLLEVGDNLTKSDRYERMKEFGEIVRSMLKANDKFTYHGKYYQYHEFSSNIAVSEEYFPEFYMPMLNGSKESLDCIEKIADTVVTLPRGEQETKEILSLIKKDLNFCLKVQLLARPTQDEALAVLKQDRRYRERRFSKHSYFSKIVTDDEENSVFYPAIDHVGPIIVGDYQQVYSYLSRYLDMGIQRFIVPNLLTEEEINHCSILFEK